MRDKVPLSRRKSLAQAVALRHRVLPVERSNQESLVDMGAFDKDVDGASTALSVSKKNRVTSLTIAGRRVNLLVSNDGLVGKLLDPLLVHGCREK